MTDQPAPSPATTEEIEAATNSTAPFIYEMEGQRFEGTCIITADDRVIGVTAPMPISDAPPTPLHGEGILLPFVLVAQMTPKGAAGMRRRLTEAGATGWEYQRAEPASRPASPDDDGGCRECGARRHGPDSSCPEASGW